MALVLDGVTFQDPSKYLPISPRKIGGTHEMLAGDLAQDIVAIKRRWEPSWLHLTKAQYDALFELYTRAEPLPLVMPDGATADVLFLDLRAEMPWVGRYTATVVLQEV